jgi:hypothetical protein
MPGTASGRQFTFATRAEWGGASRNEPVARTFSGCESLDRSVVCRLAANPLGAKIQPHLLFLLREIEQHNDSAAFSANSCIGQYA